MPDTRPTPEPEEMVQVELTRAEAQDLQRHASSSSVMYHTQLAEDAESFYAAISHKLEAALSSPPSEPSEKEREHQALRDAVAAQIAALREDARHIVWEDQDREGDSDLAGERADALEETADRLSALLAGEE